MNTGQRFLKWAAIWFTVALVGSSALAQTTGGSGSPESRAFPTNPHDFGPLESVLSIGAASLVTWSSAYGYDFVLGSKYGTSGPVGVVILGAAINLPAGAVIDVFEFEVYDVDPNSDVEVDAYVCNGSPAGTPCTNLGFAQTSGTPGWTYLAFIPPPTTIDNLNNQYFIDTTLPADGQSARFRRAEIFYHLKVSPAPLMATFTDVPTSDFGFQFIEAFSAAGITAGCKASPPQFCPDRNVTRREMAIFFAKALGLFFQ